MTSISVKWSGIVVNKQSLSPAFDRNIDSASSRSQDCQLAELPCGVASFGRVGVKRYNQLAVPSASLDFVVPSDMNAVHSKLIVALVVSFVVTSALGIGFLFLYWAGNGIAQAGTRSLLFVAIVGCVHLAGYLLYVQQTVPETTAIAKRETTFEFSPRYCPAVKDALVLQTIIGILTGLMLDGGGTFGVFQVAFLGQWLGILLIVFRRPQSPTRTDLLFIRFGIVILLFLAGAITPFIWSMIGESELSGIERLLGN